MSFQTNSRAAILACAHYTLCDIRRRSSNNKLDRKFTHSPFIFTHTAHGRECVFSYFLSAELMCESHRNVDCAWLLSIPKRRSFVRRELMALLSRLMRVCVRICARFVCAHQSRRLTPHMYDVRNRILTRTPNANRQIFLAVCLRTDKISVGQ